ncbi:MAG: hypothetical protein M1825_004833 [Sarcosagium campestre]|nr:MAG: hypothetical protein M1825_004833 [Sarcosagium campestre]
MPAISVRSLPPEEAYITPEDWDKIQDARRLYLLSLHGTKGQRQKLAGIPDPYDDIEEITDEEYEALAEAEALGQLGGSASHKDIKAIDAQQSPPARLFDSIVDHSRSLRDSLQSEQTNEGGNVISRLENLSGQSRTDSASIIFMGLMAWLCLLLFHRFALRRKVRR